MVERPDVDAKAPRSEVRRGVFPTTFGGLGAAAGMLAASTMLPDGCALSAPEAERIRWNLPWVGTIVFVLLGLFLARRLSSRGRFLVIAGAGTVVAALVFSVATSLLYEGGLIEAPAAFARFGFLYLGLLGAVIFIAREARRPGSGVTRSRCVIAATAVTIGPLEVFFWATGGKPVDVPFAAATWALSAIACVVLLALAFLEGRDVAALARAAPEGAGPYRALPPEPEDPRLAVHRRARRFVWCLLAVAAPSSAVALHTWRSLPPPEPPARDAPAFSWGC
jgi:hypothetical protein